MKRTIVSSLASFALASAFVAAQGASSPTPSQNPSSSTATAQSSSASDKADKAKDMTLTGCLVQGSTPTTFILEDAKTASQGSAAAGQSFVLSAGASSVDFKKNLNHKVTVTGTSDEAMASSSTYSSPSSASSSSSSPSSSSPSSSSSSSSPSSSSGSSVSSGSASQSASVTAKADEKDMAKLTAKNVVSISESCTAAE